MRSKKRIFFVKFATLSLLAMIVGLTIAHPANLAIFAQLGLLILFQMPLHESAHYLVAKWFYDENEAAEIRCLQKSSTEAESEFVNKYLAPRFGFNAFYGIESLKIIPAIFIQELNYTGKQFAFITLAGPIVDFSLATIYITFGLALGPMTLLGFFSTQTMLHFGVLTILTWTGAFALKKLDLGQFRYSRVKRNAYNRFLVGLWYLGEAVLDEQGQLILDKQPGQVVGVSRLCYLFEKLKNGTISKMELDLLIEAVIAGNPPLAKLAHICGLLQRLNIDKTLTNSQLTELETEIGNVEKSLKVHKIIARMNDPVYFGFDLVATGHGVNSSTFEIQNLLGKMKEELGTSHEVPYFVAGGKLIFIMESRRSRPKETAAIQTSLEFGDCCMQVREVRQERQAFKGRKTIQVGIAKMQAPADTDYSRELAHAEVLWDMIKGGGVA